MNTKTNNNDRFEEIEDPCMFVEVVDRDFDDSGYQSPDELSGEMAVLEDARPPHDLCPLEPCIVQDQKHISPDNPQTWLLNSMNHNEYFAGLRTCLKDDDPLAFPQVQIKGGTIALPFSKPIKPSISGTMPAVSGKTQAIADLSFAAATVAATTAAAVGKAARKIVVNDRTHSAQNEDSGSESPPHPTPEQKIKAVSATQTAANATVAKTAATTVEGPTASGAAISDPEIIQFVLGNRPGIASDMYTQFKRLFPHGKLCPTCNKPLQAITATCQVCGAPTQLEFRKIKHIKIGNQNADWLEAALSSTRLKFIMLYVLLFAATFYLGHKNIFTANQLIGPFMAFFMLLFFWRMIALFWRRYATIRARRNQYLANSPEVIQEVKEAIWKNRYDQRMTPAELELVQGFNVFSDIKNETILFFIGDRRY
jgi:hypothetical protein